MNLLSLTKTESPTSPDGIRDVVRTCVDSRTPIYPIGGGTSLDFGLPPKSLGIGLSLAGVSRLIDYPSRDMTVTVESGLALGALQEALAQHGQWLPVDPPNAHLVSLHEVLSQNLSGPSTDRQGPVLDPL